MHYLILHHLPKFQTGLIPFRGVTSKKPAKMQPKIVLSAAMKTFEI